MSSEQKPRARIPRNKDNDYSREAAAARREFVREQTGAVLENVGQYSFDPAMLPGNIEHFTGVAQVPLGLAGPLRINGEHARGDFYIPMATSEGTLVASYNRGMRLLSECGGVKTTVVEQFMQRSPVFIFDDALAAREFGAWVTQHFDGIKAAVSIPSPCTNCFSTRRSCVSASTRGLGRTGLRSARNCAVRAGTFSNS